jgi:hypothetical protein
MAMTLRLDETQTAALRAYAEAHGISMHAAAIMAVEKMVAGDAFEEHFTVELDWVIQHYAGVLARLADA